MGPRDTTMLHTDHGALALEWARFFAENRRMAIRHAQRSRNVLHVPMEGYRVSKREETYLLHFRMKGFDLEYTVKLPKHFNPLFTIQGERS